MNDQLREGLEWAVIVDYKPEYRKLLDDGQRIPYSVPLPEVVARFKYIGHAQALAQTYHQHWMLQATVEQGKEETK
jgi:hypothetical protein